MHQDNDMRPLPRNFILIDVFHSTGTFLHTFTDFKLVLATLLVASVKLKLSEVLGSGAATVVAH